MHATLHLPVAHPRYLTEAELTALHVDSSLQPQQDAALREVLGTTGPVTVLVSEPGRFAMLVPEQATLYDYGRGRTPSAETDYLRLTGVGPAEPLTGPVLVLEA